MHLRQLIRKTYKVITPYMGITSVADDLLKNSSLVVMEQGEFIGLLTPSDIIEHPHRLVIDCLGNKPRIDCEDKIESILNLMKETHDSVLPVFQEKEFIGVVTQEDITDYLSEYRKDLEAKVTERTQELKKRNEQLEHEIAERKRAEEQVKASLKEKTILLQEVHHRVKNNIQLISSLLKLGFRNTQDDASIGVLKELQNRIRAMHLIHEKLYESDNLASIGFSEYIRTLANNLYQAYAIDSSKIALEVNVGDVSLGINHAIPCGLIINELLSNSLKHAFRGGKKGKITVKLQRAEENEIELVVSDNGVGIPRDLNFRQTDSLGLHLLTILAEDQLDGRIELDETEGTRFTIRFKAAA